MKKALVIDGNSMVYRMFYASLNQLEYYKARNLQPANAIKLFLLVLLKILTQTKYDYALVAFDHQKKTLRHNEFAEYKAGRKPMPEDLFVQLPVLKELIEDLGVHVLSMEGIEADDIIGSYAKKNNKNGVEVDIFSSDKDMLQLVNELTVVNLMKTGISDIRKVSLETFKDNFFGLTPEQVNDFKGIAGDSSDNLMGVKGIGEVSAVNLLKQWGHLENIFENIDKLTPSQAAKFSCSKDHAMLCKKLSVIDRNVLDNVNIEYIFNGVNTKAIEKIISKYHFSGFDKYL